jgi:hypothetical protein
MFLRNVEPHYMNRRHPITPFSHICCKKLSISVVGVSKKLRRLSSVGSIGSEE